MEIKNAKIESTMLGFEDHGIFTYCLQLDYGGSGQGFGTYMLDAKDPADPKTVPHNYGIRHIRQILGVVGVEKWEDLPGKYIRVEAEHDGIRRIGNILEDKWFDPKEFFKTPVEEK